MMQLRFLNAEEFRKADDDRVALARSRGNDPAWLAANPPPAGYKPYGWASLHEITGPGVGWYVPWYYDPDDVKDTPRREKYLEMIAKGEKMNFLSVHYWQDWADKRPPICVLCPNGQEWCIDQVSSNGEGWKVTGEPPLLSCSPSIVVPGYHGFLGINGVEPGWFTDDIEGRGPNGNPR